MAYSYDQRDWEFPVELVQLIHKRVAPVVKMQRKRSITPVPGGPSGGPAIGYTQISSELRTARRAAIDEWNKENP
jgi:hypothetical protein